VTLADNRIAGSSTPSHAAAAAMAGDPSGREDLTQTVLESALEILRREPPVLRNPGGFANRVGHLGK
jgi:hypothetical protein